MSGQIEQGVNIGHGKSFWTVSNFYYVVARTNFAFLQDAKVESRPVLRYQQSSHPGFIHAYTDAVARYAWLRHFKYGTANAVAIPNTDFVIGKSLYREVFSELAQYEVFTPKKALPESIGVHLVDENGALLPAVSGEIALPIAHKIKRARRPSSLHWVFPNGGMDGLTVPCHVARKTDIY
jgi:hypothetical protein